MVQGRDGFGQGSNGIEVEAGDHGRFLAVEDRQQQAPNAPPTRACRDRQDAARGLNAAVERQLPQNQDVVYAAPDDRPRSGQHAERDRQIERRAAALANAAGAGLTVTRCSGNANPEWIALLMRSARSRPAGPTTVKPGDRTRRPPRS